MLCDAEGGGFGDGDAPGAGRLAPGPIVDERFALGDATRGYRLFGCNTLQRDRDPIFGNDAVNFNDADALNCYMEVGALSPSLPLCPASLHPPSTHIHSRWAAQSSTP